MPWRLATPLRRTRRHRMLARTGLTETAAAGGAFAQRRGREIAAVENVVVSTSDGRYGAPGQTLAGPPRVARG